MDTAAQQRLRVFFVPFMSPGHMIPMVDMAKLFSRRGVAVTVVTTPGNEPLVRPAIDRANSAASPPIHLILIPFPSSVAHLVPHGRENLGSMSLSEFPNFITAFFALQQPLDDLLRRHRPDCIVSDLMFTWTADTAADLGVPRLVFHGPGIFPLCVHESLSLHTPFKRVADDSEVFAVEGLPHRIEMTRPEVSEALQFDSMMAMQRESVEKSYGVVVNSFYELEPAYADLYRKKPGRRAWYIGPVSLCDRDDLDRADRGSRSDPGLSRWLSWLDSQAAGSVLYVCFGSLCEFTVRQLREIASGLEASGRPFMWVVRGGGAAAEWSPEGVEGRGVVIRGWAPQVVILNHPAVGGFLTHCGWNSTLEGATAGVPMITWPLSYDQFVNEKLITQVLEVGVSVGRGEPTGDGEAIVRGAAIVAAVSRVMGGGEEAESMRRRAGEYAARAKAAMEEGGSSFEDLSRLIDELVRASGDGGGGATGKVDESHVA